MNLGGVREVLGASGAGKYIYQASRAAQDLGTTTPLTVGLDLASGTLGIADAKNPEAVVKAGCSLAKGVTGGLKISEAGQVAQVAAEISPIVSRTAAGIGVVLGTVEVGRGIKKCVDGAHQEGKNKIISGACDIVTQTALGIAAGNDAVIAGVPVAAVALGIAGTAVAGKYIYKYHEQIGALAHQAGQKVAQAAHTVGQKITQTAQTVVGKVGDGVKSIAQSAQEVVHKGREKLTSVFSDSPPPPQE